MRVSPPFAPAALIASLIAAPVLAAGSAAAQSGPATPSPPMVVRPGLIGTDPPVEPAVLQIPAPQARCGPDAISPVYDESLPSRSGVGVSALPDLVLNFSTAADGRVLSIRPDGEFAGETETIQAAFAAWRFPAGARGDCRLTVRWRAVPFAQAETPDLLNFFAVTRTTGQLRNAIARRLGGDGADCGELRGGRRPETVVVPDLLKGRRPPPGGRSWTVLRWNIDAEGRATDVVTLGSSGDADLDAEGLRAVAQSRMYPGPARTGCVYNFFRNGEALPAPPVTPENGREDPLQDCPPAIGARLTVNRDMRFPPAFQDRGVEGWALVRFDVAPWGQIGNVAVVEAQPAAAFGEEGRRLIQRSQVSAGFQAGVRCVVPVRFITPPADAVAPYGQDTDGPPSPPASNPVVLD